MISDDAGSESSPGRSANPYFGQVMRRKPATGKPPVSASTATSTTAEPVSFLSAPEPSVVVTAADVDAAENELRVVNSALAIERRMKLKIRDQLAGLVDSAAATEREIAVLESRIVTATAAGNGPAGQAPRTEGDLLLAIMDIDDTMCQLEREYNEVTTALTMQLNLAGGPAKRSTRANLQKQTTQIRVQDQSKKAAMLQKQVAEMEAKNRALSDQIAIMKNGKPTVAAAPLSGRGGGEANGAGGKRKDAELAQLQDAISKESKSINNQFTAAEQEAIQRTQQKRLELNAAEHLRLAKESEKTEIQNMVEAQNKAFAQATQRKADLQKEMDETTQAILSVKKNVVRLDESLEACNNRINCILLQSSEVPMLQERAWQQEKAQLESKVFSSTQAVQVLRKEKDALQNTLKTLTSQVSEESSLMSEMRDLHFALEELRVKREQSAKDFAQKLDEEQNNHPSQKPNVIKSLESGIAAAEKRTQSLKESNESLRRKIKGAQALLTANGLAL